MTKEAMERLIKTYLAMTPNEAVTLKRNFTRSIANSNDKTFYTFCSLTPFVCSDIESPETEIYFQVACMMSYYLPYKKEKGERQNNDEDKADEKTIPLQKLLRKAYQEAKASENKALIKRIELLLTRDEPTYVKFYSSLRSIIKISNLDKEMQRCNWVELLSDLLYWDSKKPARLKWTRAIVSRSYQTKTQDNAETKNALEQ